jgi:hypothetical protein
MSRLSDTFKVMREHSKEKKKRNYEVAMQKLISHDIRFEEGINGFVRVYSRTGINYHFWPSTGYWCLGKGYPSNVQKGRGIFKLLKILEE